MQSAIVAIDYSAIPGKITTKKYLADASEVVEGRHHPIILEECASLWKWRLAHATTYKKGTVPQC